jgi:hypothetical protein
MTAWSWEPPEGGYAPLSPPRRQPWIAAGPGRSLAPMSERANRNEDNTPDPIEIWGRRIGRSAGVVAFVGLCIYLYVTYLR